MKAVVILASIVIVANAASYEEILLKEWDLYKAQFNRNYDDPVEDYYRMRIFKENKYAVASHNLRFRSGEESFEMSINRFSDMLPEEVNDIYNGFNKENRLKAKNGEVPELPEIDAEEFVAPPNFQAPTQVNWITSGAVTPIKDQGKCGSCYAFAAVGALEGHLYLKNKKLVDLSPQQVVDCSSYWGNKGCNGGLALYSFNYIRANGGINDLVTYPYEAKVGTCRYNPQKIAGTCAGVTQVPAGNEEALKNAVANGPVAVSVDAGLASFQQYQGGIYSDPSCSSSRLNHAVLVVGYGTDAATKKDYWLIKNSWSTDWGEKGYFRLARNANNMCGVATRAVYPRV